MCDIWSIGVTTFVLLSGEPPFFADNQGDIFDKIMTTEVDFSSDTWQGISDAAKDFVSGLLTKDPKARLNYEQIMGHPWIT